MNVWSTAINHQPHSLRANASYKGLVYCLVFVCLLNSIHFSLTVVCVRVISFETESWTLPKYRSASWTYASETLNVFPTQIRQSFDFDMTVVSVVFLGLCINSETVMGKRNGHSNNVRVELTYKLQLPVNLHLTSTIISALPQRLRPAITASCNN